MATPGGFSVGISPEEKLALPLDDLIQKAKTKKPFKKKPKKQIAAKKAKTQKLQKAQKTHKQQNVKKTVLVPISKAARARAHIAVASSKRQAVMNNRRPGLVLAKGKAKKLPTVQLRSHKTAAARKQKKSGGLDVSNIINHFRTHPKKFDVPKGSNLRITINLNNVKPVVGGQK